MLYGFQSRLRAKQTRDALSWKHRSERAKKLDISTLIIYNLNEYMIKNDMGVHLFYNRKKEGASGWRAERGRTQRGSR